MPIEQPNRFAFRIMTAVTAATALFLVASLLVYRYADDSTAALIIGTPGRVLFQSFHIVAWWAPVFFTILTAMMLFPVTLTWPNVVALSVIHLPVLTIGVIVRLISAVPGDGAPLIAALERSFTVRGALLISSLLLAAQSAALLQFWRRVAPSDGDPEESEAASYEADRYEADPSEEAQSGVQHSEVTHGGHEQPTPDYREREDLEWDAHELEAHELKAHPSETNASEVPQFADSEADGPEDAAETADIPIDQALERLKARLAPESTATPAAPPSAASSVASPADDAPVVLKLREREPEHEPKHEPKHEPDLEPDLESERGSPTPTVLPWHQITSEDYDVVGGWDTDDADLDDEVDEELEDDDLYQVKNVALDADVAEAEELDQFPPPAYTASESVGDRPAFHSGFHDSAELDYATEPDYSAERGEADEPNDSAGPDATDGKVLHTHTPTAIVERTARRYVVPVEGILNQYGDGRYWEIDEGTRAAAEVLRVTLEEFGIQAEVTGIRKGPVITMFEILPAPGVKLAKITNLADNIALRLAASSVRIVAPIPGKHAVGIEIPNKRRSLVSFGELLQEESFYADNVAIPIAVGKDIPGEAQIIDLTKTPHLLIAGATGSGKSVCVNSIICSILYRRSPAEVRLILIDPKIVELKFYNDIPHLLTPVITDPKRAFQALQYLLYEMERRYSLLDALGVRDVNGYNAKIKRRHLATEPLPYIVVLIDEFADLMATSGKELESTVARLAAMSRAVGIHLVLATQRPSTDVITGLIKANIPSRIAFMVASKIDSRIIIDAVGAEKLLGRGDMLFTSAWDPFPVRMQGAFLSDEEVERVVEQVKQFGEPDYIDDEIFIEEEDDEYEGDELEDPLMERAIEIVQSARKASASYLQRRLKVGYNRAARMVEEMERMGIVGPQNGSKPREVMGSPGAM